MSACSTVPSDQVCIAMMLSHITGLPQMSVVTLTLNWCYESKVLYLKALEVYILAILTDSKFYHMVTDTVCIIKCTILSISHNFKLQQNS